MLLQSTFRGWPGSVLRAAWIGSAIALAVPAPANNIRVTNAGLAQQDAGAKTVILVFDLAWDNSWRDAENWDAAWVFVKFRAPGSNAWEHAALDTNSASHAVPANATNSAVPDGKGVFIYRDANYTGEVNYAGIRLKWNYGSNGYDFATGAVVEVSVHALEMVYVPEGAFYLGSGGSETARFYQYTDGLQSNLPYLVTSETNPITVGTSNGNLDYPYYAYSGDRQGVISNLFPKGYAAFYCMKYELSQRQYADFLNMLPTNQSANRYPNYRNIYRYAIDYSATNYYSAMAPDRACNFLSWADGCAYADWSALRPMTELEYEKACRGAAYPVTNEYAWGNTNMISLTGEAGTAGSGTETASPTNANYHLPTTFPGPVRGGIFGRAGASRMLSGASYYGVMELSGNLAERCVSVGTNAGRAFTGANGDGALTTNGDANVAGWPGTDAIGAGFRAGGYSGGSGFDYAILVRAVSDRELAAHVNSYTRLHNVGWRCVRRAP